MSRLTNKAFKDYDENNPHIWDKFEHFTFEAIDAGREYFGAKCVWERMRW